MHCSMKIHPNRGIFSLFFFSFPAGELSTACLDINPPAHANGTGDPPLLQDLLKGSGFYQGRCLAGKSTGRVERNDIDMRRDTGQQPGQSTSLVGRVIYPLDQSPFESYPSPGGLAVFS